MLAVCPAATCRTCGAGILPQEELSIVGDEVTHVTCPGDLRKARAEAAMEKTKDTPPDPTAGQQLKAIS